ncbi:MAG: flippase, partial [bacterium]|nr:flippase [bacterium]
MNITKFQKFLFENKTLRQTIAKNTFWLFFGQIANRLLKAALVIYAARLLGAEGYGVFSFALSFAMMVLIFSDMGIGPLLVRETAKNQNEETKKKYLSTSFWLKFFLMFVCLSLIFAGIFILPNRESAELLWIFLFMIVANLFRDFFLTVARSLEKMEIEAFTMIIEVGATVIMGFVFLKMAAGPQGLAWAYSLGAIIGLLFPLIIFRRWLIPAVTNFDGRLAKKIAGWAWPFAAGALISSILTYTDTLMLGWLKPIQMVGWYAAAIKIPLLLIIPGSIIHGAILPALSRLKDSKEKYQR